MDRAGGARGPPGRAGTGAAAAGVELDELEAMVRRVVAEELRPVQEALARLGTAAPGPPHDGGSPVGFLRERMRQRRQGR